MKDTVFHIAAGFLFWTISTGRRTLPSLRVPTQWPIELLQIQVALAAQHRLIWGKGTDVLLPQGGLEMPKLPCGMCDIGPAVPPNGKLSRIGLSVLIPWPTW